MWISQFFRTLMSVGLSLMKNLLTLLVKSISLPLGLKPVASATDAAIEKKICGSIMTALILPNEKMEDTMKIVKH